MAQRVKRLSAMQETWVLSLSWEDPLEKGMATHSRTLAWKTPWTEEPRRLQFMVTQITGHDEQLHFHFHFKFQCKASLSTISTEHVKERQHWIPSPSGLLI